MKKKLWWSTFLSVLLVLLVVGCGKPRAIKPLADDEKNKMVEVALNYPEVSKWLGGVDVFSTEVGWVVIAWENSQAIGWYWMDYEDIKNGEPPSDIAYITDDVTINPQLYIRIGEPARMFISVIFDSDRDTILSVELQPGRPTVGPTP